MVSFFFGSGLISLDRGIAIAVLQAVMTGVIAMFIIIKEHFMKGVQTPKFSGYVGTVLLLAMVHRVLGLTEQEKMCECGL